MASDTGAVFRALADSTRRVILDELRARDGQTLFEIVVRLIERRGLRLSRQAVSKHLAVLEAAGLVETEWKGRTKIHTLDARPIRDVYRRWLSRYTQDDGSEE